MTNILGYQTLKICEPHGNKDVVVVKIDGDCLVGFCPDFASGVLGGWVYLKDGPEDFGYCFLAQNNLVKYDINWDISGLDALDQNSIGKLSLCLFKNDASPVIIEALAIEESNIQKRVKLNILEQIVYDFTGKEFIAFEPTTSYVTLRYEGGEYFIENIEDIE